MDVAAQYCPTRKKLEERILILVDRLDQLTSRLNLTVGNDHEEFISARADCHNTQAEIHDSRLHLQIHRSEHGC